MIVTATAPLFPSSARSMRTAILSAPGRIDVVEQPVPTPERGQVRVRIEGCGVCASNLEPWAGRPWFSYPFASGAPGHEAYGWIDAIGDDSASRWHIGDRVALLSSRGYAEYDITDADALVALPSALEGEPVPGEPLGCAMNILLRAGIARGMNVAIVGVGFLGALLTQLASGAGARVIALSRRGWALDLARGFGAADCVSLGDPRAAVEQVRALTGGRLCDVTIEAAGTQATLDLATELTGERSRLVIAGYHQDGPRTVNMQLWNWRGLDVINAHERAAAVYLHGMRAAVAAVCSGQLRPASLYTHRFPLEDLATALDLTRDRPDGFMKALVIP